MPTDDLTYEKMMAMVREVMGNAPSPQPSPFDLFKPSRLMGMDVYVEPEVPKIQLRYVVLSDGTPLFTKEFRDDMNTWLLARFGCRDQLCKDRMLFIGANRLMVGTQHVAMLRNFAAT